MATRCSFANADARIARTKIIANILPTPYSLLPDFVANGSRIIYDGWLKADPESNGEEVTLPKCARERNLTCIHRSYRQTDPTACALHRSGSDQGIGEARHRQTFDIRIHLQNNRRARIRGERRPLAQANRHGRCRIFIPGRILPTYIGDTFTARWRTNLTR